MDFSLTPAQRDLRAAATDLAVRQFADRAYRRTSYAWDSAKVLAEAGFTGITVSTQDGGQGGSLLDAVIVLEAVSRVCPHSGDVVQATNFGAIRQVATLGGERLRQELLPALVAGDRLISVGMSEPDAGSALTDLRTSARYDGDAVVLNGQKCWTTHGPEATDMVVWCRFGPGSANIGAVVVPTDTPGFTRGPVERFMSGEQHCVSYLDEVRVDRSKVLGDRDVLGRLMSVFGIERTGNAVRALALAESAFDIAREYAASRRQFGRPLCTFQGIQWKFAEMRTELDAARLLIYRAAANASAGAPSTAEASIAKLHCNQAAFRVANEAIQICGASGYSQAMPLEYIARRIRGWMIAGGTLEMLKNRIAEEVFDRRFPQRQAASAADR